MPSVFKGIQTTGGVQPSTDSTALATQHYTFTDKVRFDKNGKPEKLGGWLSVSLDNSKTIDGIARNIFTDSLSGKTYTLIGTHTTLYSLIGTSLVNITPLDASTTAIANSLDNHYDTLSNDPIDTVLGSNTLTITDSGNYVAGDIITLSGSAAVGGVPALEINADHIVRSVGTGNYTISVATSATSTATGGGAVVVRASGLITVNATAHNMTNGDRTEISGALAVGGITAPELNLEFIIRNVQTNTFDIFTSGTSTSSVTGGGGAGTLYQKQISDGNENESVTTGYGAGLYGVGLYGVSGTSSNGRSYPRMWFADRYGDKLFTTAGNQTGIYEWDGNTSIAPTLITNAPTAVNYTFVSNNILVTLGAGGTENRIFTSDINDFTVWTSSSVNQVFDDDIEGAARLLSHVQVSDYNLIFTENQTYTFRYIGQPLVWDIESIDRSVGIIGSKARVSVRGTAYWMGQDNFYMYSGGDVVVIPSDTKPESTLLKYVFGNLNYGQKSKCFAWYNKQHNEVWFHYPTEESNEPDGVARVSLDTFQWSMDTFDRTCGEYPSRDKTPRLIDSSSVLYKHETGTDADGVAMPFTITTNMRTAGKDSINVRAFIPDNVLSGGDLSVNVIGYQYPQSATPMYDDTYTVINTTERLAITFNGRFWTYTISGNVLGQAWKMGSWIEELQVGSTR